MSACFACLQLQCRAQSAETESVCCMLHSGVLLVMHVLEGSWGSGRTTSTP